MINLLEELKKQDSNNNIEDNRIIRNRKVIIKSIKSAVSPNHLSETYYLYAENIDDPNFTRWIKGRIWNVNWKIDPKILVGKRVIINGWFVIKHRYTYIHSILLNGEKTYDHSLPLDRFKNMVEDKLGKSASVHSAKSPEEEAIDELLSKKTSI